MFSALDVVLEILDVLEGLPSSCHRALQGLSLGHHLLRSSFPLALQGASIKGGIVYLMWTKFNKERDQKLHSLQSKNPREYYPIEWRMCIGKLNIIVSNNGLSPGRRQAIIGTNAGILLIGPLGTNFSDILIWIQTFSFMKMHLKMSSGKWWPFGLGLNVLITNIYIYIHIYILIRFFCKVKIRKIPTNVKPLV